MADPKAPTVVPVVETLTPVVEPVVEKNPELEELKLQNEYLLSVIQRMAKHLNCEGLL